MKIDWLKIKQIGITVAAVLGLLLGLVNYFNGALPVKIESLGGSNFTQIDVADGTVGEPALGFTSDLDNGLYRIGTNNIGIAAGGSKIVDIGASGVTVVGSIAGTSSTLTGDLQGRNITATGTLSVAGASTFAGAATMNSALNMSNAVINNIGNAGTDFDASGGLTANNGFTGTLNTASQTNVTALGTLGYLTVTNPISMAGATFTGPIKYGVATNYTSGAAITHGFVTTPTVCGMLGSSALVTATVSIAAATTFSFTTEANGATIYWMCGQ